MSLMLLRSSPRRRPRSAWVMLPDSSRAARTAKSERAFNGMRAEVRREPTTWTFPACQLTRARRRAGGWVGVCVSLGMPKIILVVFPNDPLYVDPCNVGVINVFRASLEEHLSYEHVRDLTGHRVLVPGGTGTVGEGVVRAFLRSGAEVIVPTRSEERLRAFRELLGDEADERLHAFVHDYTSFAGAQDLVDQVVRYRGRL